MWWVRFKKRNSRIFWYSEKFSTSHVVARTVVWCNANLLWTKIFALTCSGGFKHSIWQWNNYEIIYLFSIHVSVLCHNTRVPSCAKPEYRPLGLELNLIRIQCHYLLHLMNEYSNWTRFSQKVDIQIVENFFLETDFLYSSINMPAYLNCRSDRNLLRILSKLASHLSVSFL